MTGLGLLLTTNSMDGCVRENDLTPSAENRFPYVRFATRSCMRRVSSLTLMETVLS